ncbi:MAG: CHAD domain-containing protein [Acidimicrobiia bacterium]|nr:CHAD domain-containing protein [Acidimicrobiia bacterium]
MAFRLSSEETLADAVRRIAHQETADALDRLSYLEGPQAVENIHDCRKRCKKVRGLVRLVRPALGEQYLAVNRTYRDAARELSEYRDAQALLSTFDKLVARSHDRLPAGGFAPVRAELAERARAATQAAADDSEPIDRARNLLMRGDAGIDNWTLKHQGWAAAAGGAARTYRRGVEALDAVERTPTPDLFHELRKRVKYTWYHVRLLHDAAPSILGPLDATFGHLSDTLGDAHDLAVLKDQLLAEAEAFGGYEMVEAAGAFLDQHRVGLERQSTALAARLYAEEPKRFVDRLASHWFAWDESGRADDGP